MPLFGTPGEQIGYSVHAGSGGPPLLLIHGFTASSASFVSNIPGLSSVFTVVTVDLLGHGRSEAPADPAPYGPGPAVERIRGLLDYLGYRRVLLCGHSLGAALALRFALDAPERLAGLILINSMSAAGTPGWREAARPRMVEMAARARAEGTGFLRSTRLYPAHSKRLPEEARELLTRDFDNLTPAGFAGTAEALTLDVNSYERLPELAVRTLVVIGDRDADFVRAAPAFIERLPQRLVRSMTIPGAGHAANLEQPDLFNNGVVGFALEIGYLAEPAVEGRRQGRLANHLLTVAGAVLVVGGVALLVAAMTVGRGGPSTQRASGAEAQSGSTSTPTSVSAVSGARTVGTLATAPAASPSPSAAAVAPSATFTPVAQATAVPPTPVRAATSTPQPTATPTAALPTATPSAPFASFTGPSKVDPGATATFIDASSQGHFDQNWSASNGASSRHTGAFTVTFGAPGCYSITISAVFPAPTGPISATRTIAVGEADCPP